MDPSDAGARIGRPGASSALCVHVRMQPKLNGFEIRVMSPSRNWIRIRRQVEDPVPSSMSTRHICYPSKQHVRDQVQAAPIKRGSKQLGVWCTATVHQNSRSRTNWIRFQLHAHTCIPSHQDRCLDHTSDAECPTCLCPHATKTQWVRNRSDVTQ
jgi:hypothetical protein